MTNITLPTEAQLDSPATLDQRQARVAWSIMTEPGDTIAHQIMNEYGDPAQALADVIDGTTEGEGNPELHAALERWMPRADLDHLAAVIRETIELGITVLIPGDPDWPTEKLDRLGDTAPVVLYVRGNPQILNLSQKAVAIVGSRSATGYGEHVTMGFVTGLVEQDVTVVSGAAYGIDAAAHTAALAASGRTIAVLAGGLERFYPAGNEQLIQRIADTGAIVSELPVSSRPTKWRFEQRNRIIAALSDAVVVIEAGSRSGALVTARHASAIGVPVGAVPGPVTSAASDGTNRLLRDGGAQVVTTAEEAFALTQPEY
jgi:DNA processing protein